MDSTYSHGGRSVGSYTNITYPQVGLQSSPMPVFVKQERYSSLPHGIGGRHPIAENACYTPAACHLPQELPAAAVSAASASASNYGSDTCMHMGPHSSSHQPSDGNAWPSPPLGPGDIQNCVSFHDSPASASSIHLPCYSSPDSPAAWSSPTLGFLPPSHGSHGLLFQSQHQPAIEMDSPGFIHICTPSSSKDFSMGGLSSDAPTTSYMGAGFRQRESPECEAAAAAAGLDHPLSFRPAHSMSMPTPSPTMATVGLAIAPPPTSCSSGAGSPDELCAPSPASVATTKDEPAGRGKGGRNGARGLAKSYTFPLSADSEDAKNEEPYAKLIYKALMSRSDYCMSLQDLYQWFRDNTNKASDEKGGWQNSIRHNLSMNAAFTKRDQKLMADGSSTPSSAAGESGASQSQSATSSGDLKRVNEWVLEDWAVRDGVQSTTRYRKGGSTRKTSSKYTSHPGGMGRRGGNMASNSNSNNYSFNFNNSMSAGQQQHSSTRALSGRKGGRATKVSRLRGQRCGSVGSGYGSPMRRSPYDQGMMHQGPDSPSGAGMVNPYFSVVPLSRLGPGSMQAPMSQISDDGTHFNSPEATGSSPSTTTTSSSPFGIHMGLGLGPRLAHGYVGAGGDHHGDGVGGVSTGGGAYLSHHEASGGGGSSSSSGAGSMYLTPSPVGEFPYGIADVQLSYPVDARGGEIAATERFFSPLHGSVGDWAHHHGL